MMGIDENGDAFVDEPIEDFVNFAAASGVETIGGLVENEKFG